MDSEPNKNREIQQERLNVLIGKSQELLLSDWTRKEDFDRDDSGTMISQLTLKITSDEDGSISELRRLGVSRLEINYVPPMDQAGFTAQESTVVTVFGSDGKENSVFYMTQDEFGEPIIQANNGGALLFGYNPDSGEITNDTGNLDNKLGYIPDATNVTVRQELELASLLNAAKKELESFASPE